MFDSPFEYCSVCAQYVLLDQTQRQCAREHGCRGSCPLQALFTGHEFATRDPQGDTSGPIARFRRPTP